jgi:mono/diheme cytochrome c family protein
MKKFLSISVIVLSVSLLFSCNKSVIKGGDAYVPTQADATAWATLSDLTAGYNLYTQNCGTCHTLPSPDGYSSAQWTSVLPTMIGKAGLTAAQELLIEKYVKRGKQ